MLKMNKEMWVRGFVWWSMLKLLIIPITLFWAAPCHAATHLYSVFRKLIFAPFVRQGAQHHTFIIIVYYTRRQQYKNKNKITVKHTLIQYKNTAAILKCWNLYHINTECNDTAKVFHAATLYDLPSYLEPNATNILSFNDDKVFNTTLSSYSFFTPEI